MRGSSYLADFLYSFPDSPADQYRHHKLNVQSGSNLFY
jgi:hypothetical protein